jgi:acyl-CoA thioesterase FadM
VSSGINHLSEAMPFDVIYVRMYLDKLYERGMDLDFEFLKETKGGSLQKLAYAKHKVVWITNKNSKVISHNIPKELFNVLAAI